MGTPIKPQNKIQNISFEKSYKHVNHVTFNSRVELSCFSNFIELVLNNVFKLLKSIYFPNDIFMYKFYKKIELI